MTDIRISLTDKTIAQLPAPKEGWYLARDTELKGFFVVIGKRRRTFTVQGDLRRGGKRASSIRVSIGDASEMSTRAARATAKEYLAQISRGRHPKDNKQTEVTSPAPAMESGGTTASITLRQAWERYLEAHLVRKNRSEKTIEGYRDHVERIFAVWLDATLYELATDPASVAKKPDKVTSENGPYMAALLHNESLVSRFSRDGAPYAAMVALDEDASTPTGYRWAVGEGPNIHLTSGTLARAEITTRRQRPLDLVIPLLKHLTGIDG